MTGVVVAEWMECEWASGPVACAGEHGKLCRPGAALVLQLGALAELGKDRPPKSCARAILSGCAWWNACLCDGTVVTSATSRTVMCAIPWLSRWRLGRSAQA